jgi:hypothetical protein
LNVASEDAMKRKLRPRQAVDPGGLSRRRPRSAVAAVATFRPEREAVVEPAAKAEEDPAEEAVRRMVEAAYT